MADEEQWVNVAKNAMYVEDEVTAIERLAHLHFECEFKQAKLSNFKIRVVPRGSQVAYTKKEKGRNQNFKTRFGQGAATNTGQKKVKLERDVFLPAAGGDKFLVEAKHKGTVVESTKTVVTRRRLFYQNSNMQGITAGDVSGMETEYWAPRKYWIKLKQKAAGTIPFIKGLYTDSGGTNNYIDFIRSAKPTWSLEARKDHAFMLVWVNYIATQGVKDLTQTVNAKIPSKMWTWNWAGLSFEFDVGEWLWYGIVDAHDASQDWLESIQVDFTDKAGVVSRVNIPKDRVTIAGNKRFAYGGYHKVNVNLTAPDLAGVRNRFTANEGTLTFVMRFKTAVGWTNGFSFNGVNMITVADKASWQDSSDAVKKYTLNHEFGHKIGMVADGVGRAPDKPGTYYTGQNHQGPHCSNGAAFSAAAGWSGSPICVMFGADGVFNGAVLSSAPPTYCGTCQPVVRKLDLSAGMPGFANTPNNF
jgi:hypothetical protein